jgi:hypothetical protein
VIRALFFNFFACWTLTAETAALPLKADHFIGCCDASAAVALSEDLFVVANDEDNILRVYSRERMGRPITAVDVTGFLNPGKKTPEVDIEAAARIGDRIYWISSHGRNAKGKERESRHRFFATSVAATNGSVHLKPVGSFYSKLLNDLGRDPRLRPFGLTQASRHAPKEEGALNIEGLAATPQGHLIIGFRNPLPYGKALLVPLLNPDALITGGAPQPGNPMVLDLGGLGIRSIELWRDRYLIVAGSHDGAPGSRLFEWMGGAHKPRPLDTPALGSLNPEALTVYQQDDSDHLLLMSDDGTLRIRGEECKRLKDEALQRFRVVSFPLARRSEADTPTTVQVIQ